MSLSIAPIAAVDAETLAALFERIRLDPASIHFHPHPFTYDEAKKRTDYRGSDFYALLLWCKDAIGYGFLRGWDEGYEIPSLGIYVVDAHRGHGAAKALMEYLHHAAKLRGASCVRIRVYPDNARALRFYRKLGYHFLSKMENGQLVGLCEAI